MTLRGGIILAILVSIVSGVAFVAGVGETADRVALVLLCWSSMAVPAGLAGGRFVENGRGDDDQP